MTDRTEELVRESTAQLQKVVSNIRSLRTILDEEVLLKINLKSIGELRRMLDPMINELDFRCEKILDFMEHSKDPMIAMNNLYAILHSVQRLYEYIDTVKNSAFIAIRRSHYDGKIRRETGNLNQDYVHLLTTLSWDDDGHKMPEPPIVVAPSPEPEVVHEPDFYYTEGYKSYHGIGRPKNFSFSFESFEESIRLENNSDSMVYLSDFYLLGLNGIGDVFNEFSDFDGTGTSKMNCSGSWKMGTAGGKSKKHNKTSNHVTFLNPKLRLRQIRDLLERAISLGNLEAKYRMACLILVEEMEPSLIFKACERKFNGTSSNIYSHSVLRNILEAIYNNDQDITDSDELSGRAVYRPPNPDSIFQDFDASFAQTREMDGGKEHEMNSRNEKYVDNRDENSYSHSNTNSISGTPSKPPKPKAKKQHSSAVQQHHHGGDGSGSDTADMTTARTEMQTQIQPHRGATRQEVIDKAVELYLDAAASGHPASQRQFGIICELIGNYADATEWYSKAAQAGDADAYNCLGLLTHNGRHTKVGNVDDADDDDEKNMGTTTSVPPTHHDYEVAYGLFMAAANAGCSCAYNNIGLYHELGLLQGRHSQSNKNNDRQHLSDGIRAALYYYSLGAQFGSAMSMYNLGYLLIRQYRRQPERDDEIEISDNHNRLSLYNQHGHDSNYADKIKTVTAGEESLREGLMWLRKAADFGHLDANFQLGILSEAGSGVPRDYNAAFQQYAFICRSHAHHPTTDNKDTDAAVHHTQLVAKASWHAAKLIYYEQILTESFETMLEYLMFAASNGVVDAILLVGNLYTYGSVGNNFESNIERTVMWYYLGATEHHSIQCINLLLHLLLQLVADEQSLAKAKQQRNELLSGAAAVDDEGNNTINTSLGVVATSSVPSQLTFSALDGSCVFTVNDIYNVLYELVTSGKFKKLTVEAEYQLIYHQLTQLAKLLL